MVCFGSVIDPSKRNARRRKIIENVTPRPSKSPFAEKRDVATNGTKNIGKRLITVRRTPNDIRENREERGFVNKAGVIMDWVNFYSIQSIIQIFYSETNSFLVNN